MPGESDGLGAPDEPVDPEIVVGLGGIGGGASGNQNIGDSFTPGFAGGYIPIIKSDPTGGGGPVVPLPGAGLMGMAGLVGVMAATGRRRR
jgi:hypothetical protein